MKATLNPPVTETKVVEIKPATVTITMSMDEATKLKAFMGFNSTIPEAMKKVYGDTSHIRTCNFMSDVRNALVDVDGYDGIKYFDGVVSINYV